MTDSTHTHDRGRRFSWLQLFGMLALTMLATVFATVWIVRAYVFPAKLKPVALSVGEERVLEEKLTRLEGFAEFKKREGVRAAPGSQPQLGSERLQPERYNEEDAEREITFNEREVNALVARNSDLAERVAIDLADNLVSAKLLVALDPDFPFMGGKTLRLNAGVEMAYANGRPIVVLKGLSIMGVPIPNAWLGGIKNIDLVERFGGNEGLWKAFAAGVEALEVRDGSLRIKLKE